jgi:hypothetical protein
MQVSHLFQSKIIRYRFMQQHTGIFNLERMAKILKVSRSGYYNYLKTKGNRKIDKDLKLVTEIKAIFASSRSTMIALEFTLSLDQMVIK